MDIDLDQLKRLMRAFRRYGLSELEIQQGDAKVVLRRDFREGGGYAPAVGDEGETTFPLPVAARAPVREPAASVTPAPAVPVDEGMITITAPLVGTFYRAPSPQAPAFVEVGATVKPGAVVCIIEAMKLMNEIESEVAGTVVEVLVENGRPVEYGTALFRVRRGG